ncbi:MAG: hypothetical protein ACOYMR_07305 [Ilumatobacteraceae bacterium]
MRTTTTRTTKVTTMVATAALLLGLGACGSDSKGGDAATGEVTAEEQPYVDAMVKSIQADGTAPFTGDQASCLAKGMVNIIGVDEFEKAGITPENIGDGSDKVLGELPVQKTDDLVKLVFDGDCFSFGTLMADQLTKDTSLPIEKDKAECLGNAMGKSDAFRKAFVASLTGDTSTDPFGEVDIFKMFSDCGVSLGDVTGTTG